MCCVALNGVEPSKIGYGRIVSYPPFKEVLEASRMHFNPPSVCLASNSHPMCTYISSGRPLYSPVISAAFLSLKFCCHCAARYFFTICPCDGFHSCPLKVTRSLMARTRPALFRSL